MNGELLQAVAIALHGSAWLADPSGPVPELADTAPFRWAADVTFPDGIAVGDWLQARHAAGIDRIWLAAPEAAPRTVGDQPIEAHQAVAFASAGNWAMVTLEGAAAAAWPARWDLGDRARPDQRIWHVTYREVPTEPDVIDRRGTMAAADALEAALRDVEAFASTNDVDGWAEHFRAVLAMFDAPKPRSPLLAGVLPDGLPDDRRRLAVVAANAWVFGGMGSWNDLGFGRPEPQGTYDRLSATLYRAVLDAVVAVVNG